MTNNFMFPEIEVQKVCFSFVKNKKKLKVVIFSGMTLDPQSSLSKNFKQT